MDLGFHFTEMFNTVCDFLRLDRRPHPDMIRNAAILEEIDILQNEFGHPTWPFCEDLICVFIGLDHHLKYFSNILFGHAMVEQITHTVHENIAVVLPLAWLF